MRKIKFSKFTGQGNDFIIIDSTIQHLKFSSEEISKICNRNFGIGADGLILVEESVKADYMMKYYNNDGTIAEMCGNGIRCMAVFIYKNNLSEKKLLNIETLSGVKEVLINTKEASLNSIKVNMGLPEFNPEKIPVNIEGRQNNEIFNYKVKINSNIFNINCVSMGNPHCVVLIDENMDLNNVPLNEWGPALENFHIFPKKTNVEFIRIVSNKELSMRVWERGVGETLACGTGACAAVVCATKLGKIKSDNVRVNLPGGKLNITWKNKKSSVFLEGTVNHIFNGEYFI